MNLVNKNVIYVGGLGGIGFAACQSFLKNGISKIIVCDVEENKNQLELLKTINEQAEIIFMQLDLLKHATIDTVFAAAHKELGCINILINGSGIMDEHNVQATIDINLLGPIYCTFAAIRFMDKSKGGNGGLIVNISSLVGLDAYGAYAVYTATKYGLNGFTRALADPFYYAQTGIAFITICPSTTETPMLESLRRTPNTTFELMPPLPKTLCNNQTAEQCAQNILEAIRIGKNGSIWILSSNQLKEFHYPSIE